MRRYSLLFLCLFLVISSLGAAAQTSPFLPEDLYRKLTNEISGDMAYDNLRQLTQYHAPNGAGRGFNAAAAWIAQKAREAGLEDVKVHQLPYTGLNWTPLAAEAWLLEPGPENTWREVKLGSYAEVATHIANNSRNANIEAELIDVGAGASDKDYEGKDVKGKVVLASGPTGAVHNQAVWKRGALGVISYYTSRVNPFEYPDQVAWGSIPSRANDKGQEPTFGFMVSYRAGTALAARLRGQAASDQFAPPGGPPKAPPQLRVRVKVESEILPAGTQGLVEGWIRGSSITNEQVVLTAHIQEEKTSANDDRSGCSNLLEIARALVRMINEGKLPRPQRDIRFWWANEISAEYQWFAEHPEDRANVFVNINQDMVGANATIGGVSRVQHVTRTPWSRPTFFNDVIESVVMSLYYGNNSYLSARQAGSNAPGSQYSRPLFSSQGTRDRYSVEVVPYFDSTDHLVFNDAWIGTVHGGTTFTNWPDEYIHSSGDDIWQMDPTTFKRNAVAVSALTWFMANVGPKDVAMLTDAAVPGGIARIHRDVQAAQMARYHGGGGTSWDRENVLRHAVARERAAAESIRTVAGNNADALRLIESAVNAIAGQLGAATGRTSPEVGAKPDTRVPARIESVAEYLKKVQQLDGPAGFHGLMAYEALNFADGKRTVWDIYAAVRAESLATGEWYYGKVTPETVTKFFDAAAKAGVVTMK
jgi:hypothetical protein